MSEIHNLLINIYTIYIKILKTAKKSKLIRINDKIFSN